MTSREHLPIEPRPFAGAIGRNAKTSRADFSEPVRAPEGAPNVVVVLLDDVGFGQPSTFGGPVDMPFLDQLASQGLRYTQFHTTAMCSPTRAALLTGRNHHAVGFGMIAEMATGFPGYSSIWPRSAACLAEVLRSNGYSTAAFGKWHNTPEWESNPYGPFDRWPSALGFEYFYGFLGAATDQWSPNLVENTRAIDPPGRPEDGYHLDVDLADRAIAWMRLQRSIVPDRPFFLYYAPATAHDPHHAPREWIDRYAGRFDHGWDRQRELTLEQQKRLGVVPPETRLTPRPPEIPAWESLNHTERRVACRLQETFAAALSHCDEQIGRVLASLEELGERENTLIIYVAGDNGPSAEGGLEGSFNKWAALNGFEAEDQAALAVRLDDIGGHGSATNYPVGWAWAGSSPLQWFKQIASHFGGTRNGLVVSWPHSISDAGGIRSQFHHCIDIAPTVLAAAGIPQPETVNGVRQSRIDGADISYSFDDPAAPSPRATQYFEIFGHRALYHDGWIASARHGRLPWQRAGAATGEFDADPWELYHVDADFSQAHDLAASEGGRLGELQDLWWSEAGRNHVLPLDDRARERQAAGVRPTSGLSHARTRFVYYPGAVRIPEASAPNVKGRSHTISVDLALKNGDEGVLVSAGGGTGGYVLFVRDMRLHYVHNLCDLEYHSVVSDPFADDVTCLRFEFKSDEARLGSGGAVRLWADDTEIGSGHIPRTVPLRYSFNETFDVGSDSGTPVVATYRCPFAFTGTLERVEVQIRSELNGAEGAREKAGVARIEASQH